jgi:hypothetical protein
VRALQAVGNTAVRPIGSSQFEIGFAPSLTTLNFVVDHLPSLFGA